MAGDEELQHELDCGVDHSDSRLRTATVRPRGGDQRRDFRRGDHVADEHMRREFVDKNGSGIAGLHPGGGRVDDEIESGRIGRTGTHAS
jgi:hypothetical protein